MLKYPNHDKKFKFKLTKIRPLIAIFLYYFIELLSSFSRSSPTLPTHELRIKRETLLSGALLIVILRLLKGTARESVNSLTTIKEPSSTTVAAINSELLKMRHKQIEILLLIDQLRRLSFCFDFMPHHTNFFKSYKRIFTAAVLSPSTGRA